MLVGEAGVALTRGLLAFGRPFARVGDRQRRGDHQHLAHACPRSRRPGSSGRPAGRPAARASRRPTSVIAPSPSNAPSSCSSCTPSRTLRRSGGSRKGNFSTSPSSQRRHLQQHRGEVRAQDLGIGEARAAREVLLGVEPDAHPGATRPHRPARCVGRRLRDRLDRQPLHLGPPAVARDARACPGRRRSGCPARSATSRRRWSPARRGGRCAARTPSAARRWAAGRTAAAPRCAFSAAQCLGGVADLALAGQEHQTSPGGSRSSSCTASTIASVWSRVSVRTIVVHRDRPDRRRRAAGSRSSFQRAVADLDRVRAAGHLDDRAPPPKCAAKRCGSIVADVTMTFRSGRRGSSSCR